MFEISSKKLPQEKLATKSAFESVLFLQYI